MTAGKRFLGEAHWVQCYLRSSMRYEYQFANTVRLDHCEKVLVEKTLDE